MSEWCARRHLARSRARRRRASSPSPRCPKPGAANAGWSLVQRVQVEGVRTPVPRQVLVGVQGASIWVSRANSRSRREASKPTAPCHTLSSSVSTGSSSGEKGGAVVCGSDMRSRLPKPTTYRTRSSVRCRCAAVVHEKQAAFPALVWSPAIQATPSSTRGLPVESAAVGARGATILSAKPWSRIASLSASSGSTSAAQPNEPG